MLVVRTSRFEENYRKSKNGTSAIDRIVWNEHEHYVTALFDVANISQGFTL